MIPTAPAPTPTPSRPGGASTATTPAPDGAAERTGRRARVRTFHPRGGRRSARHIDALTRLWPRYGLAIADAPADPIDRLELFGRAAALVLEIGSGMGEATAEMAAADPARDYIAVEVHTPGVANLLALIEERGLTNLRVARGDALELVRHQLPPDSLDAVHIFFPDPWPKGRHHKRRLIVPERAALIRSRLAPGGMLHCATDWRPYAESMLDTLSADPGLVNAYDGFAPRAAHRPATKFELRGIDAGRTAFDLAFRRRPDAEPRPAQTPPGPTPR